MKDNKPNKELTDQLKKGLKLAQTKEELDALVSSAGMELNDDELDAAAGGASFGFYDTRHRNHPK